MPPSVLIKANASLPALWAAKAISVIEVTLGDNLVIKHFAVSLRTALTNSKVAWAS